MNTKARAAQQSTDRVEDQIAAAMQRLQADRWCNGFGIYTDRTTVRSNLQRAKLAVEAAIAAISQPVDWPHTDADYGEA